jgi:hypothetical protein
VGLFVVNHISLKRLYPKVPHLKWQVLKTVYACLLPCEDLVISKGVWSDILGSSYFLFFTYAIVVSVRLRFTGSNYPFDIFKFFGMYFPNFHDDRYNYINNNEIKV